MSTHWMSCATTATQAPMGSVLVTHPRRWCRVTLPGGLGGQPDVLKSSQAQGGLPQLQPVTADAVLAMVPPSGATPQPDPQTIPTPTIAIAIAILVWIPISQPPVERHSL